MCFVLGSSRGYSHISNALYGEDYTLEYLMAGYTRLTVGKLLGDANGDGAVDLLDLDILSVDLVADPPAAVPEPGAFLLALSLAGCAVIRRAATVRE